MISKHYTIDILHGERVTLVVEFDGTIMFQVGSTPSERRSFWVNASQWQDILQCMPRELDRKLYRGIDRLEFCTVPSDVDEACSIAAMV